MKKKKYDMEFTTIATTKEDKKRFLLMRLELSTKLSEQISEARFLNYLLDFYEKNRG